MSNRLTVLYKMRARLADEIYREEAKAVYTPLRTEALIVKAAELYDVSFESVLSATRDANVVRARQAACWLLRGGGLSFPKIGAIVGRDHTTVMHACTKIDNDPAIRALLWPILAREATEVPA